MLDLAVRSIRVAPIHAGQHCVRVRRFVYEPGEINASSARLDVSNLPNSNLKADVLMTLENDLHISRTAKALIGEVKTKHDSGTRVSQRIPLLPSTDRKLGWVGQASLTDAPSHERQEPFRERADDGLAVVGR